MEGPHLSEILAPDDGPLLGGMGMFLPAPAPDMTLSTAVAMGSGLRTLTGTETKCPAGGDGGKGEASASVFFISRIGLSSTGVSNSRPGGQLRPVGGYFVVPYLTSKFSVSAARTLLSNEHFC